MIVSLGKYKTPASGHTKARPWLALGLGAMLVSLAPPEVSSCTLSQSNPWIELVEITRHLLESPVFVHHAYCTTEVGEKSIGRTLNLA